MTPHTAFTRPVAADALVLVDLGDGAPIVDRADALYWGAGLGPNEEGRIQAYRVIEHGAERGGPDRRPTRRLAPRVNLPRPGARGAIAASWPLLC